MASAWVPCNATVVRWFFDRRGLALGISSSGASVGNFIGPPIIAASIAAFGWRTTVTGGGRVDHGRGTRGVTADDRQPRKGRIAPRRGRSPTSRRWRRLRSGAERRATDVVAVAHGPDVRPVLGGRLRPVRPSGAVRTRPRRQHVPRGRGREHDRYRRSHGAVRGRSGLRPHRATTGAGGHVPDPGALVSRLRQRGQRRGLVARGVAVWAGLRRRSGHLPRDHRRLLRPGSCGGDRGFPVRRGRVIGRNRPHRRGLALRQHRQLPHRVPAGCGQQHRVAVDGVGAQAAQGRRRRQRSRSTRFGVERRLIEPAAWEPTSTAPRTPSDPGVRG